MRRFTLAMLGMTLSGTTSADHPSTTIETGSGSPIVTISGATMPAGGFAFGIRSQYIDNEKLSEDVLADAAFADQDVHSISTLTNWTLNAAFGVTDDFTLTASLPYVKRRNVLEAEIVDGSAEIIDLGDPEGIGDLTLLGLYRIVQTANTDFSLLGGLKIPTGRNHEINQEDQLFEAEQQPGSGSFDPLLGAAYSHRFGRLSFDTNVLYSIVTSGTQRTDIGDLFNFNAALSFRASGGENGRHAHPEGQHGDHRHWYFDLIGELNGESRDKLRAGGEIDDHTGGTVVYFAPGIRFGQSGRWSAFLSLGVPVIDDLNGTQSEPNLRLIGGLSVAL